MSARVHRPLLNAFHSRGCEAYACDLFNEMWHEVHEALGLLPMPSALTAHGDSQPSRGWHQMYEA